MNKSLLFAARAALIGCAIITASYAFSPPGLGRHLFPWDKADHFASFFAITTAAIVALPRVRLIWIALFVSAAGGAIEIIQGLPGVGRDCDVWDWVAENVAIGAVMGLVIAAEVRRRLATPADVELQPQIQDAA